MVEQIKSALVILRRKQVEVHTGLKRSAIYERINPKSPRYDPTFPLPIKLGQGARAVGWVSAEIDIWLNRQIEQSRRQS